MKKPPKLPKAAASTWVEKAEHDLKNAEYTLTLKDDCPFDTVCFHAQQAVEKYLKALLLHFEIEFPKTHDLRVLIQLAKSTCKINFDVKEILTLNRYTIEARYPGDWEPIERQEAEQAVGNAKQVRTLIRELLRLD